MYCSKCGEVIDDEAVICPKCGCETNNKKTVIIANEDSSAKIGRFLITFFLGFLGSFIINHTTLKPHGFKSRTCAYFFLSMLTFGIYQLVASICNFTFNPNQESNIGYFRCAYYFRCA